MSMTYGGGKGGFKKASGVRKENGYPQQGGRIEQNTGASFPRGHKRRGAWAKVGTMKCMWSEVLAVLTQVP